MTFHRKIILAPLFVAELSLPTLSQAEFLFDSFLVPPSSLGADRTSWDILYTPYGSPNYPDIRAPFGSKQTASMAGVTPPANASPSDPTAFWDSRNATITQAGQPGAFIIGAGTSGNIYSFSGPTAYRLDNVTAYDLGTVAFQFQTDGTLIDFASIRLQYTDTSGNAVSLLPDELLREYRTSGSTFGGTTNRAAVQWDLTGLGIRTYQILYNAAGSSNSFQIATLATAATYGDIIPASRSWQGNGAWAEGANWKEGTSSNENGNVRFHQRRECQCDPRRRPYRGRTAFRHACPRDDQFAGEFHFDGEHRGDDHGCRHGQLCHQRQLPDQRLQHLRCGSRDGNGQRWNFRRLRHGKRRCGDARADEQQHVHG
jgi:hypothetical protein